MSIKTKNFANKIIDKRLQNNGIQEFNPQLKTQINLVWFCTFGIANCDRYQKCINNNFLCEHLKGEIV